MKKLLSVILVLSVTIFAHAQDAAPNPDYKLLASRDFEGLAPFIVVSGGGVLSGANLSSD